MTILSDEFDLDFDTQNTWYASHGLHPFAAKCPPQLARWAIERFTEPHQKVLDPLAGSGTTLAEARILGRNSLGMDIDPLARLLSSVKATPIDPKRLEKANKALMERIDADYERSQTDGNGHLPADLAEICDPPPVNHLDYWFLPEVIVGLAKLKRCILTARFERDLRDFYLVAFSSLILAKSSVANARDIVHSRHHYRQHDSPPNVKARFRQRLQRMTRMMDDYWHLCMTSPVSDVDAKIIGYDARSIPLRTESIDLVFTSPPYCNALDYTRAHTFAVGWLQDVLEISQKDYVLSGRKYIGTERGLKSAAPVKKIEVLKVPSIKRLVDDVKAVDTRKGSLILNYFSDMWQVLEEMGRVLKPQRHMIVVVCPSHIRKVEIPTHDIFGEMIDDMKIENGYGLTPVVSIQRIIDDRRRLLPYMRDTFGERMRTEHVLVIKKTNRPLQGFSG